LTPQDLLALEYAQLCNDWRMRDGYMQNKLTGSVFVFSVLGWVATALFDPKIDVPAPIPVRIFLGAAAYALIVFLSVAKDAYYRRGTEAAMMAIAKQLAGSVGAVPPVLSGLLLQPYQLRSLRPRGLRWSPVLSLAGHLPTTVAIRAFYFLVFCGFLALAIYFAIGAT